MDRSPHAPDHPLIRLLASEPGQPGPDLAPGPHFSTCPIILPTSSAGARTFLSAATHKPPAGCPNYDVLPGRYAAADRNVRAPTLRCVRPDAQFPDYFLTPKLITIIP